MEKFVKDSNGNYVPMDTERNLPYKRVNSSKSNEILPTDSKTGVVDIKGSTLEEANQQLSIEDPLVAKTEESFEQIDNEISLDMGTEITVAKDQEDAEENGLREATLVSGYETPPGVPSAETLERLRAAVSKENNGSTVPLQNEQQPESERPKFGISSLISRMSRSESLDTGSESRKEPNFNSTDEVENQQDKMEVPAFLRRQAN